MPLIEHSGDAEATSIVVETTPRIRQTHPKWTPTNLALWVTSNQPVRISGWALVDPEHRAGFLLKGVDMCGRYRLTAKERWLSSYFNIDPDDVEWAARWNVAPAQEVERAEADVQVDAMGANSVLGETEQSPAIFIRAARLEFLSK